MKKIIFAALTAVTTLVSYGQYCTNGPTSASNSNLESLTLNGNSTNVNYTGCPGVIGLEDQTSQVADLSTGSTYQVDFTFGTCGSVYFSGAGTIWIDWNANQTFEASEVIYEYVGSMPHTASINVTVPVNAVVGLQRMRVMQRQATTLPLDPCATFSTGSKVDFSLDISVGSGCLIPFNFISTGFGANNVELEWDMSSSGVSYIVEYGPQGYTPGTGTLFTTTTNTNQNITGLNSDQVYDFFLRAICAPGDTSDFVGPVFGHTYQLGSFLDWDENCPSSNFIEIASTGTDLMLGDEGEENITMPFPFFYQGTLVTDLRVGNNGGVLVNDITGNVGFNMSGNNGLFPFATDLDNDINGVVIPGVFHETIGTAPNRKLIIEWKDRPRWSGNTNLDPATFEIIFEEATQEFYFVYDDVDFSNPNYDYGADAEIGVRGVLNYDVSIEDTNYLQNNSCIRWFTTDCPKVTDLSVGGFEANQITLNWTAGLGAETNWTIEWGLPGFTPGNGIGQATATSGTYTITGLDQLTEYEIHLYSDCSGGVSSSATTILSTTGPECANPFGLNTTTAMDTVVANWGWLPNTSGDMANAFNIHYAPINTPLYHGEMVTSTSTAFTEIIEDVNIISSGVYEMYIQAECVSGDSSLWTGPIVFVADNANDSTCFAQELATDGTIYNLSNFGATVSNGESSIEPNVNGYKDDQGWGASGIYNSMWYTFVAPASGEVIINATHESYSSKVAVYSTPDCGDYSQFELEGANDNSMFAYSSAPNFVVCGLTPGDIYYVLHSSQGSGTSQNTFSMSIEALDLQAGSTASIYNVCKGDTVNLFNTITGYQIENGSWSDLIFTNQFFNDSLFSTQFLASQVYDFEYKVEYGCAYDTVVSQVQIFSPSNAGNGGTIDVCKNEPVNLSTGLSGSVDLGGTWYDPQDNEVTASVPTVYSIPGQFNYDYITGNGVCPDDSSTVLVVVNPTCDYLSVDENKIEGIEVYPNPTNSLLHVNIKNTDAKMNLELIDAKGRVVLTKMNFVSSNSKNTIDVSELNTGVYVLRLFNSTSVSTFRIVKQ